MCNMFNTCPQLTQLDLSNWNTSKVISTNNMFRNCSLLDSIKLFYANTSTVNKIIGVLPSRVDKEQGVIYTKNISQLNSNSLNWIYKDKLGATKYTYQKVVNGENIN